MAPIILYSSLPDDWGLHGLALALSYNLDREVLVRPLSALPVRSLAAPPPAMPTGQAASR